MLGKLRALRKSFASKIRENLLLRTVLVTALFIVLVGGGLAYILMARLAAEEHEETVRQAIALVRPRILRIVAPQELAQPATGRRLQELDAMIREYVIGPDVVRLKLWNPEGTVIYSTESSQIGETYAGHQKLQRVLQDAVVVEVTATPESPLERELGRLLEVYMPLAWDPGGEPVGALEIYLRYEPYARHLVNIGSAIFLSVALASLTLPVSLYLLYRSGWAAIREQRDRASESELRELTLRTRLDSALDGVLIFLSRLLDEKEAHTAGHSQRVATLAWACAARLGLPPSQREQARLAGLLHDIGKLAVSTEMLLRPGPLTPQETEEIRQHTVHGGKILTDVPYLAEIATAVRHHHERWDGKGYPDGLAGEAIPLLARHRGGL